ncbi:MAG: hypothetical protein GF308_05560 [Candidatus Heimdallarchaeota archaeon]|nr:hypothetical protein [Candidatus Heimdallarchaeota archaeon]
MKPLINKLLEDKQAISKKIRTVIIIAGGIIGFILFIFLFINTQVTLGILFGIIIFAAICFGTYFLLRQSNELPELFR